MKPSRRSGDASRGLSHVPPTAPGERVFNPDFGYLIDHKYRRLWCESGRSGRLRYTRGETPVPGRGLRKRRGCSEPPAPRGPHPVRPRPGREMVAVSGDSIGTDESVITSPPGDGVRFVDRRPPPPGRLGIMQKNRTPESRQRRLCRREDRCRFSILSCVASGHRFRPNTANFGSGYTARAPRPCDQPSGVSGLISPFRDLTSLRDGRSVPREG